MSTATVGFSLSMRNSVGAAHAGVAGGVVPGRPHRHRAGAGEAVGRREDRGIDQRIGRGGEAADRAAHRRNVARVEVGRRLAEGEGHNRAVVASLSEGSTMSTATVGFSLSMVTVSEPPTPVLPAASCQAVPTVTEPVPEKPSVAVKVAV